MAKEMKTKEEALQVRAFGETTVEKVRERFPKEIVDAREFRDDWIITVKKGRITEILTFLRDDPSLRFNFLVDVTAVDYRDYTPTDAPTRYGVVYCLCSYQGTEHRGRVLVKALVEEFEASIPSAVPVWKGALWPEREAYDMFGIRFEGHPDLRRILMPVDFEDYPLRKDYPLKGKGERDVIAREDPGFVNIEDVFQIKTAPKNDTAKPADSLDSERMTLNLGPQHPATHGTLRLVLEMEGERIANCVPDIGYLHTGFEKLGENMNYNQYVVVTDRMNYLSPLANNVGYSMAVEKLLGIEVPERAEYIRVILCELSRIADHLVWLGTHALDIGAFTVFLYGFEQRERLYNIFEAVTGARLTTSYTRVGGVMHDVPTDFVKIVTDFTAQFPKAFEDIDTLLTRNRIWIDRTKGIGVVSAEDAIAWSFTGPCLRGSGVERDIRKAEPYSCYEDFDFDIPVGSRGDVYDRYLVRMEEMLQSIKIVDQAVRNLPEGSVKVDDPKLILPEKAETYTKMESLIHHFKIIMDGHGIQLPPGEIYSYTESPNGELGWFIVSDGSDRAWRLRVRPPCFMNYQAFPEMVKGHMLSDLVAILGSINVIAGELDR